MSDVTRLSSNATPPFKFVWPALWLGFNGYFLIGSVLGWGSVRWSGGGPASLWGQTLLLLFLILGGFCALFFGRIKKVELAAGALHVAGLFSRTVISLPAVSAVEVRGDFSGRSIPMVRLRFREGTSVGSFVDFMAA